MAKSQVQICNDALFAIGARQITAIDESTVEAEKCAVAYPIALDTVLEMADWSFAEKRVILSPDVATPAFGFTYQFTLPSDYIHQTIVRSDATTILVADEDYKIEGGKILSDDSAIYLSYVYRNEDPATYSMAFSRALALCIAGMIGESISADSTKVDKCKQEFEGLQKRGKNLNAREENTKIFALDHLINSRF